MKAILYPEGGGDSKELNSRCREGFRKLLEECGYHKRMPRLVASGSRNTALRDFQKAIRAADSDDFIALWIDSEDPLADIERSWAHLASRDNWEKPAGATDDQVLFMTTCMETLIVADRAALSAHYGHTLQESALPATVDLESRSRHEVQDKLAHATRNCTNAYAKGKRSFEILARLSPVTLETHLPSFRRARRILDQKL